MSDAGKEIRSRRARRVRRERRSDAQKRPEVTEVTIPKEELVAPVENVVNKPTQPQLVVRQQRSRQDEAQVVPASQVLDTFFERLSEGESIVLIRTPDGIKVQEYVAFVADEKEARKRKKSGINSDIFLSDEFLRHVKEWKGMSKEQQQALAEEVGATWEHSDTERVDHMRMTKAIRDKLGIKKYKPGYRTQRARSDAKRRIANDELRIEDV